MLNSIEQARIILVNAVERLPHVAAFHFNLACYECQLGDIASAKAHLSRAIELCWDLRLRALEDDALGDGRCTAMHALPP